MASVQIIVYDLSKWNDVLHYLSLGRYFTVIEVFGMSFSFRPPDGKIENAEKLRERARLKIGETHMMRIDVIRSYKDLSLSLKNHYNPLTNNSNHFCNQFCRTLCGKSMPDWTLLLDDLALLLRIF